MLPDKGASSKGLRNLIRKPRDFFGAVGLLVVATISLWDVWDLPAGEGYSMGSGSAPRLFAILLLAVSLVIIVGAFSGQVQEEGERFSLRGTLVILAAVLFFSQAIRPLGLVVTGFCTVFISGLATKEFRLFRTIALASVLSVLSVALFIYGLGLPFFILPDGLR